jgi:glutamate racemase
MLPRPTILVFDSGLGGLTVHAEIEKALPGAHYIYVADDAAFPYGRLTPEVCTARVVAVIGHMIAHFNPDIAVIACNTASTVALPALRAAFAIPFVGTVPAVKPAAALSQSRMISILGTPGTVSREYTHDLIIQHAADCRVSLVGAPNLAHLAEAHLRGEVVSDADVLAEISPCFKEKDGACTDAVALACTHYPLLLDIYRRVAPWDVTWVDPAPAIARRVVDLLGKELNHLVRGPIQRIQNSSQDTDNKSLFTSNCIPQSELSALMMSRGLPVANGLHLRFS